MTLDSHAITPKPQTTHSERPSISATFHSVQTESLSLISEHSGDLPFFQYSDS